MNSGHLSEDADRRERERVSLELNWLAKICFDLKEIKVQPILKTVVWYQTNSSRCFKNHSVSQGFPLKHSCKVFKTTSSS